jgi:serine/threonine protein kinase
VPESGERLNAALPQLEPGAMFAGYRIDSLLDRGGMGVLYKATDLDLDRVVALKIIAPEHTQNETAVARFKAEARLAASIEHTNVVPVHRAGEDNGVLYLAMRYVPGTNLRRVVDGGPMELTRIAKIIREVAGALDAAHAKGLVHRDVKPANILVCGEGEDERAYLADFGLTKRVGSAMDLTRVGAWVGTPDYVAPEQIQGHTVDRRADVYSLGCVLYEMLTGHVAYPKDSDMAKLWAHVTDPPPMPRAERPELIADFDQVVGRATAKDPEDRYATAGDLADAVTAAVREQTAHRSPEAAQPTIGPGPAQSVTRGDLTELDAPVAAEAPAAAAATAPPSTPAPSPPPPSSPPPSTPGPAAADAPPPRLPVPAAAVAADEPADGVNAGGRKRSWGGGLRIAMIAAILASAVGIIIAVAVLGSSGSSNDTPNPAASKPAAPAGLPLNGDLAPVPTNHVDGVGDAKVRLNGTLATVTVNTSGLLDSVHAMHIHAGTKGQCPPGSAARNHGGHLTIGTKDGVPWYGPPVTSLTTRGDTTPKSILAFRRFRSGSTIHYERSIRVSKVVAAQIRTHNAVLVVHGIDWNRNGIYDNEALNRSDLRRSLPGEITAPALCGELVPQQQKATKPDESQTGDADTGKGEVFTASFQPAPDTPDPAHTPSWLCPLGTLAGDRTSTA